MKIYINENTKNVLDMILSDGIYEFDGIDVKHNIKFEGMIKSFNVIPYFEYEFGRTQFKLNMNRFYNVIPFSKFDSLNEFIKYATRYFECVLGDIYITIDSNLNFYINLKTGR